MPAQSKIYIPGWGSWPIQEYDWSQVTMPQQIQVIGNTGPATATPEEEHPVNEEPTVNPTVDPNPIVDPPVQTAPPASEEQEFADTAIGEEIIEVIAAEPPKRRWNRNRASAANLGGS